MFYRRFAPFLAAAVLAAGSAPAAAADLPSEAQNFLKVCSGEMSSVMERQFARALKTVEAKATDDQKKRMAAAMAKVRDTMKSLCPCMAEKIHGSTVLSADDKSKIWAIKSMRSSALPKFSPEKRKHMRDVTSACFVKLRPQVQAANKEIIAIMRDVSKN